MNKFYSVGKLPKGETCHHLSESYHAKWERLARLAKRGSVKAARLLTAHENLHTTD